MAEPRCSADAASSCHPGAGDCPPVPGPGRQAPGAPLFAAALHLTALGLAWALKLYYSRAGADELFWILAPLARLAGLLCGLEFTWAPGAGFVHQARGICIAPACAGVNFLILCFVALHLVFTGAGCLLAPGWRTVLVWAALAPLACITALLVNALRVAGSVFLYEAAIYSDRFTPALAHELFGICLYLGTLMALCAAAKGLLARPGRGVPVLTIACGSYLGMTVLLPLCNGAALRYGSRFLLHAALVSAGLLALAALALAVRQGRKAVWAGKGIRIRRCRMHRHRS